MAIAKRLSPNIIDYMEVGADVVTSPWKAMLGLLQHPLTDKGLAQFVRDSEKLR